MEAKPFASLSSGLLARKGAAKPAMRPQGFGSFGGNLEDLGWDDMGHNAQQPQPLPEHVPSSIAALTPVGGRSEPVQEAPAPQYEPPAPPPVVEQQRAIAERLAEPAPAPAPAPAPVQRAPAKVVALPPRERAAGKAKAAFTLRLDPDRHLKLRLACAIAGRSAQQVVTEALDEYLASRPELETLANHVPTKVLKG